MSFLFLFFLFRVFHTTAGRLCNLHCFYFSCMSFLPYSFCGNVFFEIGFWEFQWRREEKTDCRLCVFCTSFHEQIFEKVKCVFGRNSQKFKIWFSQKFFVDAFWLLPHSIAPNRSSFPQPQKLFPNKISFDQFFDVVWWQPPFSSCDFNHIVN